MIRTFEDDFRAFIDEHVTQVRRAFDWHDPLRDPDGRYRVSCRVTRSSRPLFVFALQDDTAVRDATAALQEFEYWQARFDSLAIFERAELIDRRTYARFCDLCDKGFSALAGNEERIRKYLIDALKS